MLGSVYMYRAYTLEDIENENGDIIPANTLVTIIYKYNGYCNIKASNGTIIRCVSEMLLFPA
jgi:hypothetical protein